MIINRKINKVISSSSNLNPTLLDLTNDTVNVHNLENEQTAHDKEGEKITGQLVIQDAEAYARGTRDGIPVSEEDVAYHNNAKYYSALSGSFANIAGQQAQSVITSAESAAYNAKLAQSYANGTSNLPDRPDEGTDNAYFYMTESQAASVASGSSMLMAGQYASNAEMSKIAAGSSMLIAGQYADEAEQSKIVAGSSMLIAGQYASEAEMSKIASGSSALIAGQQAIAAATSANNAHDSELAAAASAVASGSFMRVAGEYKDEAENSAIAAGSSMLIAGNYAEDSEAWADGTRNGSPVPSTDPAYRNNAKHYKDECQNIAGSLTSVLKPKGTCLFVDLPSIASSQGGDMWNIEDDFITTADFREGAGIAYAAGSNVYLTIDNKWDVLSGSNVVGVKGNAETNYRTGGVNITPANIGYFSGSTLSMGGNVPPVEAGETKEKFLKNDGKWHELPIFQGISGSIASVGGILPPVPMDGEEKIFRGKGTWDDDYTRSGALEGSTLGERATAEGYATVASGIYSHAEGDRTSAVGGKSHAEGYSTIASGTYSHAEGWSTSATSLNGGSHAEGQQTLASSFTSHAEGATTTASGWCSHAEGQDSVASASQSHAEGYSTIASKMRAHAEGEHTTASGRASHAAGYHTSAGYDCQTVVGQYNDNKSDTLFEVGSGTADNARANALEVKSDGSVIMAGSLTVNGGTVIKRLQKDRHIFTLSDYTKQKNWYNIPIPNPNNHSYLFASIYDWSSGGAATTPFTITFRFDHGDLYILVGDIEPTTVFIDFFYYD